MKQYVEGTYMSVEAAAAAVKTLLTRGYEKSDITIMAHPRYVEELEDATGMPVVTEDPTAESSAWESIKSFFRGKKTHPKELTHDEQMDQYRGEIANGKILLLVDDEKGLRSTNGNGTPTVSDAAAAVGTAAAGAAAAADMGRDPLGTSDAAYRGPGEVPDTDMPPLSPSGLPTDPWQVPDPTREPAPDRVPTPDETRPEIQPPNNPEMPHRDMPPEEPVRPGTQPSPVPPEPPEIPPQPHTPVDPDDENRDPRLR